MALQAKGRESTFLSLLAHADGDRIMVGARNTVDVTAECQVELLSSRLEDVGTYKNVVSPIEGMALPHSPDTVNSGAHNTIDAQRHMGVLPYGCFDRRLQYCRGKHWRLQYYLWPGGCKVLFRRVWFLVP